MSPRARAAVVVILATTGLASGLRSVDSSPRRFGLARTSRRDVARPRVRLLQSDAAVRPLAEGEHCMWSSEEGVHTMRVRTKGWECMFETGRIAKLAGGAVVVSTGDTMVFSSACFEEGSAPADFVPLRVDYQERYSAAGMTAGGYIKRDGRAGDSEILTARLIDRPLRPAFPKGWSQETQVCSYVLSYDGTTPPDSLAVCASSAALVISDVPFDKPVACVRVTRDSAGNWVLNAPVAEQQRSDLNVVIAGTADAMLMIEGFCNFVPEEDVVAAAAFGHEAVRHICNALSSWQQAVGKPKALQFLRTTPPEVKHKVRELCQADLERVLSIRDKQGRERAFDEVRLKVEVELTASQVDLAPCKSMERNADAVEPSSDDAPGDAEGEGDRVADDVDPPHATLSRTVAPPTALAPLELADVQLAFKALATETLRRMVAEGMGRPDGRSTTEVRPLAMRTSVLPRAHGSALFTRGETQSLATVTLGDASAEQKYEGMSGSGSKRFYLQYTFPPFSVGEVGRVGGMPGRREIGHGNLAELALAPAMPSTAQFPYTVRAESLITMSCGSSSMASVCGGCLALMDAAVPITRPVAGVAMGLLFDDTGSGSHVVLTDIIGLEDALGSMDFKVAGDSNGVTALQLDVKCEGLSVPLLRSALAQAREGRLQILREMARVLPEPRSALPDNVPRISKMNVDTAYCGAIIGKEGKTITAIIEETGVDNIDLSRSEGGLHALNPQTLVDCQMLTPDPQCPRLLRSGIAITDAGIISITAKNDQAIQEAIARIQAIVSDLDVKEKAPRPEVVIGQVYTGEVKSVMPFGIFVELQPGLDGFCHISELSDSFVRKIDDVGLSPGDIIDVQVTNKNEKGQYRVKRVLASGSASEQPAPEPGDAGATASNSVAAGKRVQSTNRPKRSSAERKAEAMEEAAFTAALNGLEDE